MGRFTQFNFNFSLLDKGIACSIEEETINEKQNKSEASDTHSQKVSSEAIINSIKTTPAKLNSIKGFTENKNSFPKTSVPMTDHIYESEK